MRLHYEASGKVTFVLCSNKLGFMLLPSLVIDLKWVLNTQNAPKVLKYNQKSCTIFDITYYCIGGKFANLKFGKFTLFEHLTKKLGELID